MNIPLLEKIIEAIEAHPEQFNMFEWDCGTTRCIAGWANILSSKKAMYATEWSGAEQLDLTATQASLLFFKKDWPKQFRLIFPKEEAKANATIAIARIRHFIKTEGAE